MAALDAEIGARLKDEAGGFTPLIVVNRVERPEHRRLAEDIALASRDYFGTDVRALGSIEQDPDVPKAVLARRPVVDLFPKGRFATSLEILVQRLLGRQEVPRG